MKVYGGKKYEVIKADSSLLVGKTFETVNTKKFIVGVNIDKYAIMKINVPSGGVIVTRNDDHSMYNETFSSANEIYLVVGEGLDSIELPDGASVEIAKGATQTSSGAATGGGGVTSWNDLEDKPFYKEYGELTEFLTESEFIDAGDDGFVYIESIEGISVGGTYTVTYNGVTYECIAKSVDLGATCAIFGNVSAYGGDSGNGEPFGIVIIPPTLVSEMGAGALALPLDGATTVKIAISGREVVAVHKLDEDFLPDKIIINSNADGTFTSDYKFHTMLATLQKRPYTEVLLVNNNDDDGLSVARPVVIFATDVSIQMNFLANAESGTITVLNVTTSGIKLG